MDFLSYFYASLLVTFFPRLNKLYYIFLALPKPPGTPVVTESTATSITLTWDSGNPEPVSYYIIQHKPKNTEELYKEIDGVATTRYSVAGLSPYSEYEFRVVAVNNIGRGPPSEPVTTRTSEQAPSSAPRNVQARMLSSTTILVQWEEPEEPNGQIQGYRVYYTMDPSQHVNSWLKHNVADSHITTIGNLVPQKTYSVKVLAFTSVGDGPLSSDIQVITQTGGKMEFMVISSNQFCNGLTIVLGNMIKDGYAGKLPVRLQGRVKQGPSLEFLHNCKQPLSLIFPKVKPYLVILKERKAVRGDSDNLGRR